MFACTIKRYVLIFSLIGIVTPAHAGLWDTATSWWNTAASAVADAGSAVSKRVESVTPAFVQSGYNRAARNVAQAKERVEKQIQAAPLTAMAAVAAIGALSVAVWYNIREFYKRDEAPAGDHQANEGGIAPVNAENADLRRRVEAAEEILAFNAGYAKRKFAEDEQERKESQEKQVAELREERDAKEKAEQKVKGQEEISRSAQENIARLKEELNQEKIKLLEKQVENALLNELKEAASKNLSANMLGSQKRSEEHKQECLALTAQLEQERSTRKKAEQKNQEVSDLLGDIQSLREERCREKLAIDEAIKRVQATQKEIQEERTYLFSELKLQNDQLRKQIEEESEEELKLKEEQEESLRKLERLNADLEAQRKEAKLAREKLKAKILKAREKIAVLAAKEGDLGEVGEPQNLGGACSEESQQEVRFDSKLLEKEEDSKELGQGHSVDQIAQFFLNQLEDVEDESFQGDDWVEVGKLEADVSKSMNLGDWVESEKIEADIGSEIIEKITGEKREAYIKALEEKPGMYLKAVVNFYKQLYSLAEEKGQDFDQGSFQVYDPAGHICEFLRKYPHAYERPTSHLVELFEMEEGNLMPPYKVEGSLRTGYVKSTIMEGLNMICPGGYSLLSEKEGRMRHLFFANIGEYTFIKAEDWETSGVGAVMHVLDWGWSQGRKTKALQPIFGDDDGSRDCKERVPKRLLSRFSCIPAVAQMENGDLMKRARAYGMSEMCSMLKKITSNRQEEDLSEANALLQEIDAYDHLDVRIGREVILSRDELLGKVAAVAQLSGVPPSSSSSASSSFSGSIGGIALNTQEGELL